MNPTFEAQAIYDPRKSQYYQGATQKKKSGGLSGFLPLLLGGAGAAVGTIAGPLGTAAGGAVGSGLGEFLRQKLSGEADDGIDKGNIVQEGLFGALPGVLKGAKALKAGKGLKGLISAEETGRAARTAQSTEQALQGMAKENKLTRFGKGLQEDVRGTSVGTTVAKNTDKTGRLRPSTAKTISSDIDTLPGKTAAEKATALEIRQKSVIGQVDDAVANSNRDITIGDLETVTKKANSQSRKITGFDADTAATANKQISEAKTLQDWHVLKRDFDDQLQSFYKQQVTDTTSTAKANTLKAYRDGINQVLKSGVDGYGDLNKIYSRGLKTQDVLLRKASKNNNFRLFGVDTGVGGETIAKTKETVGSIARKVGGELPAGKSTGAVLDVAKAILPQAGVRAAGTAFGVPFTGAERPEPTTIPGATEDMPDSLLDEGQTNTPQTGGGIFSDKATVEKAYFDALAAGDPKTAQAILTGYEKFGSGGKAGKPMSSEAAKTLSNAEAGVAAISDFEQAIAEDPGAFARTNIPGTGVLDRLTGGRVGGALGTSGIDAASQQVVDVIARLRTGAAISQAEESRFKKFIPLPGDPEDVRIQKLSYLRNQFQLVATRVQNSPQVDISTVTSGVQ